MWRKVGNYVFSAILLLALVAGAGSLATGRPVLATIIKSNSMAPVFVRGDVVFVWNWPGEIEEGDIALFKPSEGSLMGQWTMHRVVGRDADGNFLTQGDAAHATDQHDGLAGPVRREDVYGTALTLGGTPLKIPWIGTPALKLDTSRAGIQRYLLVGALSLVVAVGLFEFSKQSRRRRRGEEVDSRVVFVAVGTILSVLLIAMTLFQSIRVTLVYEVGVNPGVIMGQPIGIIEHGQVVRKELSDFSNNGFLPMLLLVSENDPNISVDAGVETLPPKRNRKVHVEVKGEVEGSFESMVQLSLIFPLLPRTMIAALARVNHWIAALTGCLIPGVAVAGFGLLEPGGRRKTARDLRVLRRRLPI